MARVIVEQDLTIRGYPDIFVVGDVAHVKHRGAPLPCIAPVTLCARRFVVGR
jgi:NADH dehydrogenase